MRKNGIKSGRLGFDFEAIYTKITIGQTLSYRMLDGRMATIYFNTPMNQTTDIIIPFDAEIENPVDIQKVIRYN